jgi:hypothetical protein
VLFEDYPNGPITALSPYHQPVTAGAESCVELTYNGNQPTSVVFQNVNTGNYETDTDSYTSSRTGC